MSQAGIQQKNKLKKFFGLLKKAQNTEFIKLVIQNINVEIGGMHTAPLARPEKLFKILHFLNDSVLRCHDQKIKESEFSRLNITVPLVQLVLQRFLVVSRFQHPLEGDDANFSLMLSSLLNGLNSSDPAVKAKWQKKIDTYSSVIFDAELLAADSKLQAFFGNMEASSFFDSSNGAPKVKELAQYFGQLLRSSQAADEEDPAEEEQQQKELLTSFLPDQFCPSEADLKRVVLGANQKLKVDKFIDNFSSAPSAILQKLSSNKRQRTETSRNSKFLVLSPGFSILVNFSKMLCSPDYEVRQVASAGLAALFGFISERAVLHQQRKLRSGTGESITTGEIMTAISGLFKFAIIEQDESGAYTLAKTSDGASQFTEDPQVIFSDILGRSVIQMMKDQFCDFEDVTVTTPVRHQTLNLLKHLTTLASADGKEGKFNGVFVGFLNTLPHILGQCQHDWQSKQSFFMMLKAVVSATPLGVSHKDWIFRVFGKQMIIQSITMVEDSVKVILCEIIQSILPDYFATELELQQEKEAPTHILIDQMLEKLMTALSTADDIEGSVIFVFDLITDMLNHPKFEVKRSSFRISSEVFFPFNFHRLTSVRRKFNRLIRKFLHIPGFFQREQLFSLLTLTTQAIIMEVDESLQAILRDNVKLILIQLCTVVASEEIQDLSPPAQVDPQLQQEFVGYLNSNLLMPERFQRWLYNFDIEKDDFEHFFFIESPCFESLDKNYFVLVRQPVSRREKLLFYLKKLEACVELLAIFSCYVGLEAYFSQFLKINQTPTMISMKEVIEYLVYERINKMVPNEAFLKDLNAMFAPRLPAISPDMTNIRDYRYLPDIFSSLGKLQKFLSKKGDPALDNLMYFKAQLDNALALVDQAHPTMALPEKWIDFAGVQQVAEDSLYNPLNRDAISLAAQSTSDPLTLRRANYRSEFFQELTAMMENFEDLFRNQQSLCDRFRALLISQHLAYFNYLKGQGTLHAKLNDIIHPVWNLIRGEHLIFYQRYFARVMAHDLLPALKLAGKENAMNSVLKLILKEISKFHKIVEVKYDGICFFLGAIEETIKQATDHKKTIRKQELTRDVFLTQEQIQIHRETRGCEMILQEWIKMNDGNYFDVYDSSIIRKALTLDLERFLPMGQEESKLTAIQNFINLAFKATQNLLMHRQEFLTKLKGMKREEKLRITRPQDNALLVMYQELSNTLSSNPTIFERKEVRFASDFLVNFFYLCSVNSKIDAELDLDMKSPRSTVPVSPWASIQIELILTIVKNLSDKSESAFIAFEHLIDQCLNSKTRLDKMEEANTDLIPSGFTENLQIFWEHNTDLLPYLVLFLIPVIKNVKHSLEIFGDNKHAMVILAMLIQLLPLCIGQEPPAHLASHLGSSLFEGQEFFNIFTQSNLKSMGQRLEVQPQAELREYQRQSISWMIQLNRYGLNCALCDDMGLGKTIQSLTVVLNEHAELKKQGQHPVSLIICPNTLTYQWFKEIDKFFSHMNVPKGILTSSTRQEIFNGYNNKEIEIIITSYEKARNDITMLAEFKYFYVVLDEGHKIKDSKSKTTLAIKRLPAERKLILSGTPLQNKVKELWSLFDFLMPNFLEEERVFNSRYNKFLTSNIKKLSENLEETQQFVQALKSLKKRIAPFIMRRTKDEVLKDLPDKQIQDYECELIGFQKEVHDYVDKAYPIDSGTSGTEKEGEAVQGRGALQNLIIHRKACNHPLFVYDNLPAELKRVLDKRSRTIEAPEDSGKLSGLIDLLAFCGILETDTTPSINSRETSEDTQIVSGRKKKAEDNEALAPLDGLIDFEEPPEFEEEEDEEKKPPVNQQDGHRALIFCQFSSFLEMVIEKVLDKYGVKHIYLKAGMSAQERFEACESFNTNASNKIMIMTTSVGGLGLNLTGADTVIFMEHDWNPMKDAQAIDRAHRIGQKRKVNVYRLILRETIEEKIMGLQQFKKNLANSLVQSKGMSVEQAEGMEIGDLLGCFEEHTVVQAANNE